MVCLFATHMFKLSVDFPEKPQRGVRVVVKEEEGRVRGKGECLLS